MNQTFALRSPRPFSPHTDPFPCYTKFQTSDYILQKDSRMEQNKLWRFLAHMAKAKKEIALNKLEDIIYLNKE